MELTGRLKKKCVKNKSFPLQPATTSWKSLFGWSSLTELLIKSFVYLLNRGNLTWKWIPWRLQNMSECERQKRSLLNIQKSHCNPSMKLFFWTGFCLTIHFGMGDAIFSILIYSIYSWKTVLLWVNICGFHIHLCLTCCGSELAISLLHNNLANDE